MQQPHGSCCQKQEYPDHCCKGHGCSAVIPCAGLLLLNRSVYDGAHIMNSPQGIPEQQFPLQQQPQQDTLLDLCPLQQQLAACSSSSGGAGGGSKQGNVAVLTPGLPQLYALLEETRKALPGHKQQQPCSGPDVGSIMQQALREWRADIAIQVCREQLSCTFAA